MRKRFTAETETRENFLAMPLNEKRRLYNCLKYYTSEEIKNWQDYYMQSRDKLQKQFLDMYQDKQFEGSPPVNVEINKKVALFEGNITCLEIDAIVNCANKSLNGGGGVIDRAIHSTAGPMLKTECWTLGECKEGQAKISAGYKLPAKYIIHTVGPQGEHPRILESCYRSCLRVLKTHSLRTVAFSCMCTGKTHGYPREAAAHVALKTVRDYLETDSQLIDLVIFCMYIKADNRIYQNLMQIYFPVEELKTNL